MALEIRIQTISSCSISKGAASTAPTAAAATPNARCRRGDAVQVRQLNASGQRWRASSRRRPAKASVMARRTSSGAASASATRAAPPPQAASAASAVSGLLIATTRVPPICRQGTASSAMQR